MPSADDDPLLSDILKRVAQYDGFVQAAKTIVADERRKLDDERDSYLARIQELQESNERLTDHLIRLEKSEQEATRRASTLEIALASAKSSHSRSPERRRRSDLAPISESLPDKSKSDSTPAIPGDGASDSALVSPTSMPSNTQPRSQSIDVSALDSKLEGIPLKAAAVKTVFSPGLQKPLPLSMPSQIENQNSSADNNSPQTASSMSPKNVVSSSSPLPKKNNGLFLSLSPPNPNLTKHAGHTPLAMPSREIALSMSSSSTVNTPTTTAPSAAAAPPATAVTEKPEPADEDASNPVVPHNTHNQRDSGAGADLEDDPELKGQLSMPTNPSPDDPFISGLDNALKRVQSERDVASRSSVSPRGSEQIGSDSPINRGTEEGDPPLRFKKSMNFGSAFGSSRQA